MRSTSCNRWLVDSILEQTCVLRRLPAHQMRWHGITRMEAGACRQRWSEYKLNAEQAGEQNRFEDAEQFWWLAMRQAEDAQSLQMVCVCLDGLADLLIKQKRYAEAAPLYRESLAKKTMALGDSHPVVGRANNSLALSLYKHGKFEEAEHCLRQALFIFQETLGLACPEGQWSARHLVHLLRDQDRIPEAVEMSKVMDSAKAIDVMDQKASHSRIPAALCEICHRPYKGMQCLRCTQKGMSALRSLESGPFQKGVQKI
jgi:tetratricopeptide (TPR) repeat protein